MSGLKEAAARRGTFWQSMRAVAWSFFGVRRGADHQRDVERLNPLHVVIAGLIGAGVFIALLVLLVRWVVGSGIAAG
ncbi:MAG: DUF2970 domain-containing protein [Burkholderiales bacterium]|nr:DUF2970 domain-containing protein [Burkholderiales bacterium]MDE2565748.1 DUF2970 domain-containing protein [Burkholderiales bacterium]